MGRDDPNLEDAAEESLPPEEEEDDPGEQFGITD